MMECEPRKRIKRSDASACSNSENITTFWTEGFQNCFSCWCHSHQKICDMKSCPSEQRETFSSSNDLILPGKNSNKTIIFEEEFTYEQVENPDFKCKPKQAFKLECNICWCAKNGKEPRDCTRIACKPKVYAPLPPPQEKQELQTSRTTTISSVTIKSLTTIIPPVTLSLSTPNPELVWNKK